MVQEQLENASKRNSGEFQREMSNITYDCRYDKKLDEENELNEILETRQKESESRKLPSFKFVTHVIENGTRKEGKEIQCED